MYWLHTPSTNFPSTSPPMRHSVPSHFNWSLQTCKPGLVQSLHVVHTASYNKNPVILLVCFVKPSADYIKSMVMSTRCFRPCKVIYTCDLKFCRRARVLRSSIQCDLPPFLRRGSTYRAERALYAETCSGV